MTPERTQLCYTIAVVVAWRARPARSSWPASQAATLRALSLLPFALIMTVAIALPSVLPAGSAG
jgi:hypothetical protein